MASPKQILDETFLTTRAKLLDVAATLDRIDVAAQDGHSQTNLNSDPRRDRIDDAIKILLSSTSSSDRAKQLQQLFSRPYDAKWRRDFGL